MQLAWSPIGGAGWPLDETHQCNHWIFSLRIHWSRWMGFPQEPLGCYQKLAAFPTESTDLAPRLALTDTP